MKNSYFSRPVAIIFVAALSASIIFPLNVFAALPPTTNIQITSATDFDLNTADTAVPTVVTASTGGTAFAIVVASDFIDITLNSLSNITFSDAVPGQFLRIVPTSDPNFTVSPACPTSTVTLTGTTVQTTVHLQVFTTNICTPAPVVSSGGGGGGGGGGSAAFGAPASSGGTPVSGGSSGASNSIGTNPDTSSTSATTSNQITFNDLSGHWAATYIDKVANKCDIEGYRDQNQNLLHQFRPDNTITRRELVKMVMQCKYLGNIPTATTSPFPDLTLSDWGVNEVSQAKTNTMVIGDPNGNFLPDQNITRAEAAKIIELAVHSQSEVDASDLSSLTAFTDIDSHGWYTHFIAFGLLNKYFSGYVDASGQPTGLFGPSKNLTRAEAAKIIANVLGF